MENVMDTGVIGVYEDGKSSKLQSIFGQNGDSKDNLHLHIREPEAYQCTEKKQEYS